MSAIDELLDQDNWYWSNDVNSVAVFDGDKDAYLPKASAELAALKSELERDALAKKLLVGKAI